MIRALCIGSSATVWDDIAAACELFEPDVVIGVNRFARDYPASLDGWTSYHPEQLPRWVDERRKKGLPDHKAYFAPAHRQAFRPRGLEPFYRHTPVGGSSGLGAVQVALEHFKADKVVCAGIRIDAEQGHFNSGESGVKPVWAEGERFQAAWRKLPLDVRAKIRSVSGWTSELLGKPDSDWIGG